MNETDIYREWQPPGAWAHAVSCCWQQRVCAERVQRVLPDGHADLLVHDSGLTEIVGLYDEVALPVLPAGTRIHGIRFRPAVVAAAFATSASALRNRTVDAESVLGSRHTRRLGDPRQLDAWIRSIQVNPRTSAAVDLLATRPVEQVAAVLGITARQLRRILIAEVGLAPKSYQQVMRLQRFVRASDAGMPLAAAAADAGYADQAHLTRDVRRFFGLSPGYLAEDRRRVG